jgi:hypothetical protein
MVRVEVIVAIGYRLSAIGYRSWVIRYSLSDLLDSPGAPGRAHG